MGDVEIRVLSTDDLDGALALSTLMGWNQRLEDWRALTELAPSGSFVALDGQRIVGTAIGIDYVRCGWIAMMLVDPGYRGRGLGARLLEAALGAIPERLPIGLDATPLGRPLYEHHGFVLETSLTRNVRPAAAPSTGGPGTVRPLRSADMDAVKQMDERFFGGVRPWLLERIRASAPEYAWCGDSEDTAGYCLGRYGRLFDHVGPVVAETAQAAIALAAAAVANAQEKSVVIDAYDAHRDFTAWLQSAGFEAQRPLYRMWRGSRDVPPAVSPVTPFAILGPEFG